MFDAIIYFERIDNYKLDIYITLFLLNFKDVFYVLIVVIYANTSALFVLIFKFVDITLKENQQINFVFILKIFYL